jgi:hypothetical protein
VSHGADDHKPVTGRAACADQKEVRQSLHQLSGCALRAPLRRRLRRSRRVPMSPVASHGDGVIVLCQQKSRHPPTSCSPLCKVAAYVFGKDSEVAQLCRFKRAQSCVQRYLCDWFFDPLPPSGIPSGPKRNCSTPFVDPSFGHSRERLLVPIS